VKFDIILSGVGGQGVLSVSAIIASAAMKEGLTVKQSEVHGMAQRGGAVVSNLRLSNRQIASDLIPLGTAGMILSMEPMESLRYLHCLSADGKIITSTNPVTNITNYPDIGEILSRLRSLKGTTLVDATALAKEAGSALATNMVMVGAASSKLPLRVENLEAAIRDMFARKGEKVVEINVKAFRSGREAAR
jgi:indolepyruvate ferredoxin oxidoreductase, beta subunit